MSPDGLSRPQAASGPSPRAVQHRPCAAGALCLLLEEPLPVVCRESSAVTQTPRLHEARPWAPLTPVPGFLSHRCSFHHDRDLRVESVRDHGGQLSSSLRPEVLEAEAVPSQLLQALLLGPRTCHGRFRHLRARFRDAGCAAAAAERGREAGRAREGARVGLRRQSCRGRISFPSLFMVSPSLISMSNQLDFMLKMRPNDFTAPVKHPSLSAVLRTEMKGRLMFCSFLTFKFLL